MGRILNLEVPSGPLTSTSCLTASQRTGATCREIATFPRIGVLPPRFTLWLVMSPDLDSTGFLGYEPKRHLSKGTIGLQEPQPGPDPD